MKEWVQVCTALNIPLSKTDHPCLKEFLHNRVKGGGAIAGSHQLQEKYLPEVYAGAKNDLKTKLHGSKLGVIFDETPDVEGIVCSTFYLLHY